MSSKDRAELQIANTFWSEVQTEKKTPKNQNGSLYLWGQCVCPLFFFLYPRTSMTETHREATGQG